jgi:hypothetical protein
MVYVVYYESKRNDLMLLVFVSIFVMILIGLLGYLVWMDDQIYNPKYIPETEQEKQVREMKLRIQDAEWKFKREIGEI